MSDLENLKISKIINHENYFINSYKSLTRIKFIHIFFAIIEIFLNIFLELEIILRGFKTENMTKINTGLNYVSFITNNFKRINEIIRLIIMILLILLFDSLYYLIKLKKFKLSHIYIIIIVNFIEIIYSRAFSLMIFNLFFTLKGEHALIGCFFFIPQLLLIIRNFLYNHLYYFVPDFIDYPYDEFNSFFDIVLLIIKLLLSFTSTTNNPGLGKFCFSLLFLEQIFFCFYFLYKLKNHSYLFMKNSVLNRTKICLFFTKTIIVVFAILLGKSAILNALFLCICTILFLIIMVYMYFIYNPFYNIKIKRETPMENIYFYFFVLSEKNDYEFIIRDKINEHYINCGTCVLCKKFIKYSNKSQSAKTSDDELEKFINEENYKCNENSNKLMDLFDIIYDGQNKYFCIMKKLILNYKQKGKESLNSNSYFFINFLFLIYSDYQNNNITLSLNERLILEIINQENRSFLDNHETQINQLMLCNSFISLAHKILKELKDIINAGSNYRRIKKIIDLSVLLKEMKSPKYKRHLFSHKLENIYNSKHLILICSVMYEEIFNITLNNSHLPIRDNIQSLEDLFYNNKINRIISLSVDLIYKKCKIIRAGKSLCSHINDNLFDLFPLIFKQYQINLFMSNILNFENKINKEKSSIIYNSKISSKDLNRRLSKKDIIANLKIVNNEKNQKKFSEIKLIICEKVSSKIYYKLLSLKLTPLLNNNYNHFIIFDGFYSIYKHTVITLQDFEKSMHSKEKLFAVSEPELEKSKGIQYLTFNKSNLNLNNYIISKVTTFNICLKYYNIYLVNKKENESNQKTVEKKINPRKFSQIEDEDNQLSSNKNTKSEKILYLEDNSSVNSQMAAGSVNSGGVSNFGIRNKRKDNIYENGGFGNIKKFSFFIIISSFIILIMEHFYLYSLQSDTYNNNNSLLEYRDFYKLYFQLFSSTIGVACILVSNECVNLVETFTSQYFANNNEDEYFNFTLFVMIQNKILAKNMMDKKVYLSNVHKTIGNKKYTELFGKKSEYFRVSQNIIQGRLNFTVSRVSLEFSEAILIICNSFQILVNGTHNPIILLNKLGQSFKTINENNQNYNYFLNDYQKEFYEMVMNYRLYYQEFNSVNEKLNTILFSKSNYIEAFIYIFITFNIILILLLATALYTYSVFFENMLIKIMNYINMTLNSNNEDFNFSLNFAKKIENLENLLEFNIYDPIETMKNLNNLYINYQQFLTTKNKNNANVMHKKNYKKIMDENKKNELDDIPKNQRIMSKEEVKELGITYIYKLVYFISLILYGASYIILLCLWMNYFSQKSNLYTLIQKNIALEMSIYRAINSYDLMVFHNYTLEEVTKRIILKDSNADPNYILNSFYNDIELAFNNKKEKNKINTLYQDFEDVSNFTCENLYFLNSENLNEISNNFNKNITQNLIQYCEKSRITESNDFRSVFERHFQNIKNGVLSIDDFSYSGLLKIIMEQGILSKSSVFFNIIVIYILEITNSEPCKNSIKKLLKGLKNSIQITEVIFLLFDVLSIIFVFFLYIKGIDNLCNQIFILKNVFKIFEIQD